MADPANKNSFVVRWHAPEGSGKANREVMLKSEDVITMNEWLDAISSEALRTEEVKQVDWWFELFGRVRTSAVPHSLPPTSRRSILSTPKRFESQSVIATLPSLHPSRRHSPLLRSTNPLLSRVSLLLCLHVSTKAVDESDEVDTSDYCSSASNRAWNSPFVISSPHLLDEGMMEREDVRAEQQAESVIRSGVESLTVAQSRKGTLLSQPSFFSDQEMSDDSDDEAVSPKLNKNMDRKTMQQIIRQHSGQELKIADGAVEDKPCTPVARNNPDTIGGDIIGGEPDCDEEFVFQYGTQYLPSPTDRPQRS
jgi:hypothetical protein